MRFFCFLLLSFVPFSAALCQKTISGFDYTPTASGGSPPPEPDVLVFTDGEKLMGQLESATDASVVFKSDVIGEVTVEWSKVQELHSSQDFAAIPKRVKPLKKEDQAGVVHGKVSATGKEVAMATAQGAQQAVPLVDLGNLVPQPAYERAFQRTSFLHGWTGGLTAGISLIEATQKSKSFTGAIDLVRAVPSETWLDLRSRTIFSYTQAYGDVSEPGVPTVKTSLYHIGGEQDWYLTPRLFVFVEAMLDHNYSQGLTLQQTYGGGLGFVVFKTANKEFDVKASADYIDQRFENSTFNKQLFGSIFGETYIWKFAHGILLDEKGQYTAAWNDTKAYSALGSIDLTFPVYHHFGLTIGALDTFLNDPPPTFKKNSFQFTAGLTYAVK